MAEFISGDERKTAAEDTLNAYKAAEVFLYKILMIWGKEEKIERKTISEKFSSTLLKCFWSSELHNKYLLGMKASLAFQNNGAE
uniref:Uncharacterized protein n=1 Tax=Chenopodium quinoa TaxID=63459 RepID=A0A803MBJ0_CHEQI